MKILIACHERVKKEKKQIFQRIEQYWKKAGFEIAYNIRNDENAIRTAIDVKEIPTDYLIVVDGLGFDAATTQGRLSYNNYAGIVLFLFLDSSIYEKYKNIEFGLNCYILISNPQYEICRKSEKIHNTYNIPRHKDDYEWSCFTEIRKDAVENERIAKVEFAKNTKLLEDIRANGNEFLKIEEEMNSILKYFYDDCTNENYTKMKNVMEKIDSTMQLIWGKKIRAMENILEIWSLEQKGQYPYFFVGQPDWDHLIESYMVLLSVLNRFIFPSSDSDKEDGLQWIVMNQISPFAIIILLEREYACNKTEIYQYFASLFEITNDVKGAHIMAMYADKYKKEQNA